MLIVLIILCMLLLLAAISDGPHQPASGQQRAHGVVEPRIIPADRIPTPDR